MICGVETELYTVGSEGSPDVYFAMKVADHMGLPIHTKVVDEDVVRKCIPHVLNAIEEWNIMKLGVGMTAYLAAEMAHRNSLRVMLSGQGVLMNYSLVIIATLNFTLKKVRKLKKILGMMLKIFTMLIWSAMIK
jgi:hypothetical protein